MIKKEKEGGHTEEIKIESQKLKIRLFKEVNPFISNSLKKSLSLNYIPNQIDFIDSDPSIAARWRQLVRMFENLSKYDHKTIISYIDDNPTNLESKCNAANGFFAYFLKRMNKNSKVAPEFSIAHSVSVGEKKEDIAKNKPLKEDLLKIFVITFQYVSNNLATLSITNEQQVTTIKNPLPEAIQNIECLNEFLLFILPTLQNKITFLQYETALVQLIRKRISDMQEKLSNISQHADVSALASIFYHHYEAMAMLTSYNATKKFMKDAADGGIYYAYEIFERSLVISLSSSLFREIYASTVQSNEEWIDEPEHPCLFISAKFGKQKFKYLHAFPHKEAEKSPSKIEIPEKIPFSLGFINLYYANKIAKLMIDREIFKQQDRTMVTLVSTLKRNLAVLTETCFTSSYFKPMTEVERPKIEAILNENCECLKFMRNVLSITDNPLGVIEKLSIANLLKSLVSTHLVVTLANGLVLVQTDGSYSLQTEDCASRMLRTLYSFKYLRVAYLSGGVLIPTAKRIKKPQVHLMIVMDEIMGDVVANMIKYMSAIKGKLGHLRELLVEYFSEEKFTANERTKEILFKLYEGPIFRYTAPEELSVMYLENYIKDQVNTKAQENLLKLLSKAIRLERKNIVPVLQNTIAQITKPSASCSTVFGHIKLLYCILTNNTYDDLTFYNFLYHGIQPAANLLVPSLSSNSKSADSADHSPHSGRSNEKTPSPAGSTGATNNNSTKSMCCIPEFIESKGLTVFLNAILSFYNIKIYAAPPQKTANTELIEKTLLMLLDLPLLCEQFLKNRKEIEILMELCVSQPNCHKFALSIAEKCLYALKYESRSDPENEAVAYFPELISKIIHKALVQQVSEQTLLLCFPLYEALNDFLAYDPTATCLAYYQNYLFQKQTWLRFLSLISIHKYFL